MPGRLRISSSSPKVFGHSVGWPPALTEVEAARGGDRAILQALLATGYPKLVSFYRGLGLGKPDAEDLAADSCESLITSLGRLRDAAAFEAWFWAIARNRFRGHLRRKQRGSPAEPMAIPDSVPGDTVELADEHAAIRSALAQLSSRDRELLWLREVAGLTYEELAGRFAAATGTVRVSVHRARRRLENAYREITEAADGGN